MPWGLRRVDSAAECSQPRPVGVRCTGRPGRGRQHRPAVPQDEPCRAAQTSRCAAAPASRGALRRAAGRESRAARGRASPSAFRALRRYAWSARPGGRGHRHRAYLSFSAEARALQWRQSSNTVACPRPGCSRKNSRSRDASRGGGAARGAARTPICRRGQRPRTSAIQQSRARDWPQADDGRQDGDGLRMARISNGNLMAPNITSASPV